MVTITSKTATADPITYEAEATYNGNGMTIIGQYHGTEDESRKEVKAGAITELKRKAKHQGVFI